MNNKYSTKLDFKWNKCLGFEHRTPGWLAQMNSLSCVATPSQWLCWSSEIHRFYKQTQQLSNSHNSNRIIICNNDNTNFNNIFISCNSYNGNSRNINHCCNNDFTIRSSIKDIIVCNSINGIITIRNISNSINGLIIGNNSNDDCRWLIWFRWYEWVKRILSNF